MVRSIYIYSDSVFNYARFRFVSIHWLADLNVYEQNVFPV